MSAPAMSALNYIELPFQKRLLSLWGFGNIDPGDDFGLELLPAVPTFEGLTAIGLRLIAEHINHGPIITYIYESYFEKISLFVVQCEPDSTNTAAGRIKLSLTGNGPPINAFPVDFTPMSSSLI